MPEGLDGSRTTVETWHAPCSPSGAHQPALSVGSALNGDARHAAAPLPACPSLAPDPGPGMLLNCCFGNLPPAD